MEQAVYRQLCGIVGETSVHLGEPMKKHTTFRIGGEAEYFVQPHTKEELKEMVEFLRDRGIPWHVIGNGSNLLVSDRGVRGAVIQLFKNFSDVSVEGSMIRAQAGAINSLVARRALDASLAGFEFAAGIPGTIGGAVVMNAGAYGGEMKDILIQAEVLDESGQFRILKNEELELGYRTSIAARRGYIVVEAALSLKHGVREQIAARMEELKEKRIAKQPLEYPSAGSTFKRPQGYFAGKLIMDAGLAGYAVGGAQVSKKHCGFVINRGGATAADVDALMREVQRRVYEKFQVELEPEVKRLGEFT